MSIELSRREFMGSAAAAGAFVFGFPTQADAQGTPAEVNAWVVVKADETVVIRIARRPRERLSVSLHGRKASDKRLFLSGESVLRVEHGGDRLRRLDTHSAMARRVQCRL